MVENRNNRLLNAKLNKYIVPGIMMSLALQLGNIVDTIFVSNLIGVEAMSAVTMSLPVETIVQLTGYCLGVGGSIAAGNMLGNVTKKGLRDCFQPLSSSHSWWDCCFHSLHFLPQDLLPDFWYLETEF